MAVALGTSYGGTRTSRVVRGVGSID